MRIKSFLRFFAGAWQKLHPFTKKRSNAKRARLMVEMLERRELLATAPFLVPAGVTPLDGSTTNSSPLLQVKFSEKMANSALNPNNYILVSASGDVITVNSAVFADGPNNTQVTLTYNGGQPLVVDAYSLFIKGDQVFDVDDSLPMAPPGRLVVANAGRNNVAVSALSGDGTIGALSNYSLPPTSANPLAIGFADLNGDLLPDMAVVNSGTQTVAIYQGQPKSEGAGFNTTPDLVLTLPSGTANLAKDLVLADFDNDGNADIAVMNNNLSTVSVYLNTRTSVGILSFSAATSFTTGTSSGPSEMVVADFDNDTNLDLAVANSNLNGTNYNVSILRGDGVGGFAAPFPIVVGSSTPSNVINPRALAVGRLNTDTRPDLVVSGLSGGTGKLENQSTPGNLNFSFSMLSTSVLTSVAIGPVRPGSTTTTSPGDVVGTSPLNGGQILIFENDGTGAFFTPLPAIGAPTNPTGITLRDMDADGMNDIVLTNDQTAGSVQVFRNTGNKVAGRVTAASNPTTYSGTVGDATNATPIVITSNGHGLNNGDRVLVSGVAGNTAANGSFTVGSVTANTFTLVGSVGNGAYTAGTGTWVQGGLITGATNAGPIVITSADHGLANGMRVIISGVGGNGAANGTFSVANVTTNTFELVGSDGTLSGTYTAGTGTWNRAPEPIVITSPGHGLANGTPVIVSGVGGQTGANGLFLVGNATANTFTLIGSAGTGAYTSGGIWTIGAQVTAATNTAPITITSAGHGLPTGTPVTIQGIQGTTAANGSFTITNIDANTFALNGTVGNGAFLPNNIWSASGVLTNATNANPIVITSTAHGLTSGMRVTIGNVQGNTAANGNYTITVIDANRFSLNSSSGNGAYTTHSWTVGGTITAASVANPIQITSAGHGLTSGARVRIAGVLGNTAANGTWTVTVIDADNFTIPVTGTVAYTGGGTWVRGGAITAATNVNPIQITSTAHGLVTGSHVVIAGVLGNTAANGTWTVTVIDADNFTIPVAGNGAYTTGGTWTLGDNLTNASNSAPIVITSVAHGLVTGSRTNITGVLGNTAANGNFAVTQVSVDQFSLNGTAGNGNFVTSSWTVSGSITAATNAGPVVISSSAHGLNTGDRVRISGVAGNTAANGSFTITRIDANNFSLNGVVGNGNYLGGGTWVKGSTILNATNTNPIRITSPAHGLVTGAKVNISGVLGNTAANGNFTITVIDADNYTLNSSVGNGQYQPGSTWNAISFAPVTGSPYEVAGNPTALALADTNQDGILDVVTINRTDNTFSVLIGNSNGTLRVSSNTTLNRTVVSDVATGDVNGDGLADIIAINFNAQTNNTKIAVMMALGDGTYAPAVEFAPNAAGRNINELVSLAVGDINGDGRLDIVYAERNDNGRVGSLLNTIKVSGAITGATAASPIQITSAGHGLTAGTRVRIAGVGGNLAANGTWTIGAVTANTFTLTGSVGNGAYTAGGTWEVGGDITGATNTSPITITAPLHGLTTGAMVKITGVGGNTAANGTFTITVVNTNTFTLNGTVGNGAYTSGGAWTLLPTVTATSFTPQADFGVGDRPTDVLLADFNKDGILDLLVAHDRTGGFGGFGSTRRGVTFALGNGTGGFGNQSERVSGFQIGAVAVGDFNKDGILDFVAAENPSNPGPGQVHLQLGNGNGTFTNGGTFPTTVTNPGSIGVADFNNDGFQDVVVASQSQNATNAGVAVLINQLGSGFGTPFQFDVLPGTGLASLLISDLNQDGKTDVIVSTMAGANASTLNNVYALIGNGQGSFVSAVPYLVGGVGAPGLPTSYLAQTVIPLIRVTTFLSGGGLINSNLLKNGNFEGRDLTGELGNLLGWEIYKLPDSPGGSFGGWNGQTGTITPFSGTNVPRPTDRYRAMLDQYHLQPFTGNTNPNPASSYSGTHTLYQDIILPAGAIKMSLTFALFIDNSDYGTYSDTSAIPTPLLDYRTSQENQQVRVDIMNSAVPNANTGVTAADGLLRNVFITDPTTPETVNSTFTFVFGNTITGASNPVAGPIVITSNNHGLKNGERVSITGVLGNTNANGIWTISNVTANTFTLVGSFGSGAYTSGGAWSVFLPTPISDATNPASGPIVITSVGHGLTTGAIVTIADVVGNTAANGTWTITRLDNNRFSLDNSTADASTNGVYVSGGSWTIAGIRVRIGATNNRGRLLVGVDNVAFNATFPDTTGPTLTNLGVRNPAFFGAPGLNTPHTSDPTIVGRISDNSNLTSVSFVEIDPLNDGFGGPDDVKTTQWDAQGNFTFSIPGALSGLNTIGVRVVDKAQNVTTSAVTFFLQTNSVTEWESVGPQGIDVSGQGVDFTKVSGRITAIVPDVSDPSGNTYFIGSANGGVWKTTNGGATWVALDNVVDANTGLPVAGAVSLAIGGLAQSRSNPDILYVGTGVGDRALDSRPGLGVLKSTDGGKTWVVAGNSASVLGGARVVKVVIDANNDNVAYAAVASNGAGTTGAVYKTEDGGDTWINVLTGDKMFLNAGGVVGSAATPLASVTDLIIDPFNSNRLIIGLGNIGLVPTRSTAGVWLSINKGASWTQMVGGDGAVPPPGSTALPVPNGTLPSGTALGRVTIAMGTGRVGDEKYVYVLIGNPPGNNTPPNVDFGTSLGNTAGLYRTKDNMLNWTKVKLKQDMRPAFSSFHNFQDINLFGHDSANVGALLVDQANPNVVYVGGSDRWRQSGDTAAAHPFIRVDTGNMRDTTLVVNGTIPNDGDDRDKAARAAAQAGWYNYSPSGTPPSSDPYDNGLGVNGGEGVYWYDLIEDESGDDGNQKLLPNAITSLAYDAQGRLLVGTVGGIWRGLMLGFSYDYSSGGDGIMGGGGGPGGGFSVPAMNFTAINGNLQISDLTSIAIDGTTRGAYFSTQIDTGVAATTSRLAWVSQGLTGPTLINGTNLGIPSAGAVFAANPPPGSPVGTPGTLFRVWQFADSQALRPESSSDNGATWTLIDGIPSSGIAGTFPAFAINPTPVFDSGQFHNELLFGTDKVYLTRTSGAVWDEVPGLSITPGSYITAMSFAPKDSGRYYVGTNLGQLFYTANSGADAWPLRNTGLPARPINAIAVDPKNSDIAYAMLGGTGIAAHVYKTVNAGQSWFSVSATLPTVAANAMVIDSQPNLGAPNGKIYLATDVGVFYSIDGAATWTRLGLGMPNVPVVDLTLDTDKPQSEEQVLTVPGTVSQYTLTFNGFTTSTVFTPATTALGMQNALQALPSIGGVGGTVAVTKLGNTYTIDFTGSLSGFDQPPLTATTVGGTGTVTSATTQDGKFLPGLHVLAAATLGRGAFTINTAAFSFIPDQVIKQGTSTPVLPITINVPATAAGLNYTLSVATDNPTLVPLANIVLDNNPNAINRTIQVTPGLNANDSNSNGPATITVTLTSGTFTYSQTFTVSVTPVNTPPTISPIGTQEILINSTGNQINFTVADSETAARFILVSATSDNQSVIPNAGLVITPPVPTNGNRTLSITPAAGQTGSARITIRADDTTTGGITLLTFDILVTVTVSITPTPFTDNFNRADDTIFLGPGWKTVKGDFDLNNDQALASGTISGAAAPDGINIATLNGLSATNAALEAKIILQTADPSYAGLIARHTGPGAANFIWGGLLTAGGTTFAQMYKIVNGVWAPLTSQVVAPADGITPQRVRMEVLNDSFKLFYNDTLVGFTNDFAISGPASFGLLSNAGNRFDDFVATGLSLTNVPALPFTEPFNTSPPLNQLSANWRNWFGNFSITGTGTAAAAQGMGAAQISTINLATPQTNGFVQANVTIDATEGSYGGIVARYTGDSSAVHNPYSNMYLAILIRAGGQNYAQIYNNVGGTWIQLSSTNEISPGVPIPSTGLLRLEVVADSLKLFLNGTLVGFGNDVANVNGAYGIATSLGAKIDNFNVGTLTLGTPTLPFTENFNAYASGAPLDSNWVNHAGMHTASAAGTLVSRGDLNVATLIGISQNDAAVQARISLDTTVGTAFAGVVARYTSTVGGGNYYTALLVRSGATYYAQLYKVTNGVYAPLGSVELDLAGTNTAGNLLRLEVAGDSVKLFVNGAFVTYANDNAWTTGGVGLVSNKGNTSDDFNATAIVLTTPSLAFSGNFGSYANDAFLNRDWNERIGLFQAAGGAMESQAAYNVATLNGINQGAISVRGNVTLEPNASVTFAGVLARYTSTAGGGNFYTALLVRSGSAVFAQTYKVTNGVYTPISSVDITSVYASNLELRLDVVGDALQLYYNNTHLATGIDGAYTTGSVGMVASQGHTLHTFNASVATAAALPFSDNFAGSSLRTEWAVRQGSFAVAGNSATGSTPGTLNFATLAGLSVANVDVSAVVTLGVNQAIGLTARFTPGVGFGDQYFVYLLNTGTNYVAQIYRVNNGAFTLLQSTPVTSFAGQVRFVVTGSSLTLSLDTVPVLTLTDTAITAAGSVGMTAYNGASFTSFTAS
jgi:hypothetical protein